MFKKISQLNNASIKKYFLNSSWMMAEQVAKIFSGIFVSIYIARYLGPESYGVVSYALAITAFTMTLARMGMDSILVRELILSGNKKNEIMGTAFWLMFLSACVCYIGLFLILSVTNESEKIIKYILISSTGSFFTSLLVIDYYFQSEVKAKLATISKSIAIIISAIIKLILIWLNSDILYFIIASVLDHTIIGILLLITYKKFNDFYFFKHFNIAVAKKLLKSAWPMIISAVAVIIYMKTDQIMIRIMIGIKEVGVYSAAMQIFSAWFTIPYIITISLLPAISKLKQGNKIIYERRMTQLFSLILWLSLIALAGSLVLGDFMITLAFGKSYEGASLVLKISMITAIFAAIGSVSARYFTIENMEKKLALRTFLAAIINIALNLFLIPIYGIYGAAISTLLCTFFANYVMDWFDSDLKILLRMKHNAILNNPLKQR